MPVPTDCRRRMPEWPTGGRGPGEEGGRAALRGINWLLRTRPGTPRRSAALRPSNRTGREWAPHVQAPVPPERKRSIESQGGRIEWKNRSLHSEAPTGSTSKRASTSGAGAESPPGNRSVMARIRDAVHADEGVAVGVREGLALWLQAHRRRTVLRRDAQLVARVADPSRRRVVRAGAAVTKRPDSRGSSLETRARRPARTARHAGIIR